MLAAWRGSGCAATGSMASVLFRELALRRGGLGTQQAWVVDAAGPRQRPRAVPGESPTGCHPVLAAESPTNQT